MNLHLKLVVAQRLILIEQEPKIILMKKTWSKLHTTLKIGLIVFVLGVAPLLLIMALDALGFVDAGNAIGPGILAMLSFYISIVLIIIGGILTYLKRKEKKIDRIKNQVVQHIIIAQFTLLFPKIYMGFLVGLYLLNLMLNLATAHL